MDPSRQSVIHVYYGDKYVKEFEQSMISTWYDLLASIGGIVALITGGSMITIVEVTYLLTGRFGANYVRKLMRKYFKGKHQQHKRDEDNDDSVRENEIPPFVRLRKTSIPFVN